MQGPPNPSQYVSLPSEGGDGPPPAYDDMAFQWSAGQLYDSHDCPPRYECSERDSMEMKKRGTKLFRFSIFCFLVDLIIIVAGAAAGRHTGIYVGSNIVALIVFAAGVINFFPRSHTHESRVRIAQGFFFILLAVCWIGFALGIWYAATIDTRVLQFCAQPGRTCHDTGAMLTWGTMLSLTATTLWIVFFSVFARSTFLYICAAERSHLARSPQDGSRMAKSVHRAARLLPHYSKIGHHICKSCHCHHCEHCAKYSVLICVVLTFVIITVLCIALPKGPAQDVFCLLLEILGSFS